MFVQVCEDVYQDECHTEYTEECKKTFEEICKTEFLTECKQEYQEVCSTEYSTECRTEYVQVICKTFKKPYSGFKKHNSDFFYGQCSGVQFTSAL